MKSFRNFFQLSTLVALVAIFTISCGNKQQSNTPADLSKEIEASANSTRAAKAKAKEMGYKSLAAFSRGNSEMSLDEYAHLQAENVNLVVLFESSAPWAEGFATGDFSQTGDDKLNALMEEYDLTISNHFDLEDGFSEGLVLSPNVTLDDPVEAARDVSLVDYVMMVHVKEVPAEDANGATANAE